MARLIDADELLRKIASVARLARSGPQQALLGRVVYIIEHAADNRSCTCRNCANWNNDTSCPMCHTEFYDWDGFTEDVTINQAHENGYCDTWEAEQWME